MNADTSSARTMIDSKLSRIEHQIVRLLELPHWILISSLIIASIVVFFAFPSLEAFTGEGDTWQAVLSKADDLSYNALQDFGSATNASKVNFRLTVPLLANILHLNVYGMYGLQVIAGIILFGLSLALTYRLTSSRLFAFMVTLMVGSTYAGRAAFVETRGLFDAVALCFLLGALFAKRPFCVLIAVFLASWTDERGLIASSLVLIFFLIDRVDGSSLSLRTLGSPQVIAVIAAWVAYFATRIAYSLIFSIPTDGGGTGIDIFLDQLNMVPMGLWTGFEGGWVLVTYAIIVLLANRRTLEIGMTLIALGIVFVISLSVVDISRSTAYALPMVYVSLLVVTKSKAKEPLRSILLTSLLLTVCWAPYYVGGERTIWWQYPLPIQAIRWLLLT